MAEFRKSRFVDQDLMAIWEYIAPDNADAADRVVRAAYATFEKLAAIRAWAAPENSPRACRRFTCKARFR